jgi:hypothetical protein
MLAFRSLTKLMLKAEERAIRWAICGIKDRLRALPYLYNGIDGLKGGGCINELEDDPLFCY